MEIWKDIEGYGGYYKISTYGRVKRKAGSPRTKHDKVLKNKIKPSGYEFVCLSVDGKYYYRHVHRLVAIAYIDNPKNKPCVNHKDLNKNNNKISNLEWCTAKDNNIHARKNKIFKKPSNVGIMNKKSHQIAQKDLGGRVIYVWGSTREISKEYDICSTAILHACKGNTKSIGFYWSIITKEEYFKLKNDFNTIPTLSVNKRDRDLTKAREAKKEKLNKITLESLVEHGVKCYSIYGNLYRKNYDKYAKENNVLTYIPVSNRFGSFVNFKKKVSDMLPKLVKTH